MIRLHQTKSKSAVIDRHRHLFLFTAFLSALLFLAVTARGAGQSSARSLAMGGAYTALAAGPEAGRFNPANLGLVGYDTKGLEVVGFGAAVRNNSFSLSDYNRYTGAVLSTADKEYILSRIPVEGLDLNADIEASALSLSLGRFALNTSVVGVADMNLSRDIFELLLDGNTIADSISVTGSYSDGVSFVSVGLSTGFPLYTAGYRQLSGGITVKYLRGLGLEKVTELQGVAATLATGFTGNGSARIQTATGGSGFAVDLGVAMKLNRHYTLGARVRNAVSHMNWSGSPEEIQYDFVMDTATIISGTGNLINSNDTTVSIPAFAMSLPPVLNVGIAKVSGKLIWAVDWEQGFRREFGVSTKPRLAVGGEYALASFLPVRAGYAVGGGQTPALSLGSGLSVGNFYMDFAFVSGSSLSGYSSKGLNLALTTGIHF